MYHFRENLLHFTFTVTGDSGYPLEPYLLTPFGHPATEAEARCNRSHRKPRVVIEHTFGILKSRFRCLSKSGGELQYTPSKCAKISVACMFLHNVCIKRRIPFDYVHDDDVDDDDLTEPGANAEVNASGIARRRQVVNTYFV